MICVATPAMNPTITALETKRTSEPARRRPATSISTPVTTASTTMPDERWSGGRAARAPPAARHSAAVGTTAMRCELAVSAATGVPTILAYRPCTGGTPARIV